MFCLMLCATYRPKSYAAYERPMSKHVGGLSISGLWRETRVPDILNLGSELCAGFVAQNVNRSIVVKMLSP